MYIQDVEKAAKLKQELAELDEMLLLLQQRFVCYSLNGGCHSVTLDKETFRRWAGECRIRIITQLIGIGVHV